MPQTNADAQQVMNEIDPTIRIEVQFPYSGAEILAFDTTITPHHVNMWCIADVDQYNMVFTADHARSIAAYWTDKRNKRVKPETLTNQILSAAHGLAHLQLLGAPPGTPTELSEANIAGMAIVTAVLEVLTIEQRQMVLEKLKVLK
jgi:hypothetical protein